MHRFYRCIYANWLEKFSVANNPYDNTFTELTTVDLTGVSHRSVKWGDYDNDSDLDILLAGLLKNLMKSQNLS